MQELFKKEINVFGLPITIQPKAYIKTILLKPKLAIDKQEYELMIKENGENIVFLYAKNQFGAEYQKPIFTMKEFGKTAEEFLNEFLKLNAKETITE